MSREILHPDHDLVQRGDEEWSDYETDSSSSETSPTKERIEQNVAQDNEIEADDSSHEELDDADDNLLDLVERDLDQQRQSEDNATGE